MARVKTTRKEISWVVTLHAEGLIAHKTLRSIHRAMQYAEQRGLATELLLVLDRATSETRRYVETSAFIPADTRIISTDFGDPGLARNAAVEQADGEYISIMDGDNLVSENWLVNAHQLNQLSQCYVIHPEVNVFFDQKTIFFYSPDQLQEDFDETNIIVQNYWSALSYSRRETYLFNPYIATPPPSGFGYEDWHWNCEVMGRGFVHRAAPGTAQFIRVKEKGSRNVEATSRNVLMRHSVLFDNFGAHSAPSVRRKGVLEQTTALSNPVEKSDQGQGGPVYYFAGSKLKNLIGSLISKLPMRLQRAFLSAKRPPEWDDEQYLWCHPDIKAAVERGLLSCGFEHWMRHGRFEGRWLPVFKIPPWLIDEMLAIAHIEPQLFPSRSFFARAGEHRPMRASAAGLLYIRLLEEMGDQPLTHVFLLPWLKAGGADLEALHHIRTLSREFGACVLVILTEDTDSPWLHRLPTGVTTLHFGQRSAILDHGQAQAVLMRLLLKVQPKVIHNINSPIGWQIFSKYGAALSSGSRLYASLFWLGSTPGQESIGYDRELEKSHACLQGVFTDNQMVVEKLKELYGFQDSLFSVLRYPVRVAPRFAYFEGDRRPKVLWASRFGAEKRPDVLQKIAQSLPDYAFHVYGESLLDRSRETAQLYETLGQMQNVTLFGSYSGFDAIPTDNYVLFLYTSQWDGMPNVVLEALASGLAVLAPDIGGIHEVIPPDSGFLIGQCDDVAAYVGAIRRVTANPQLIFAERDKRLKFLHERYSSPAFLSSLARMPLYTLSEERSSTSLK